MHNNIDIVRVTKSQIDLFIKSAKWPNGRDYTITRRGLIVHRFIPKGDTRNWYQYQIDDLFDSRTSEYDFAVGMLKQHGIAKLPD